MPGPETKNDKTSNTPTPVAPSSVDVQKTEAVLKVAQNKVDQLGATSDRALDAREASLSKPGVDMAQDAITRKAIAEGRNLTESVKGLSKEIGTVAAKIAGKT